jgi:hypothetical protein
MEFMPHHAIADPADGFTSLSLDRSNFVIHKPYDVSESERYSFQNGIHKLWVYSADKPFMSGSNTSPRTEVRVRVSTICIIYIYVTVSRNLLQLSKYLKRGSLLNFWVPAQN